MFCGAFRLGAVGLSRERRVMVVQAARNFDFCCDALPGVTILMRRSHASGSGETGFMRTFKSLFAGLLVAIAGCSLPPGSAGAGEDGRELVKLPPMMQEHMLANMRDHLVALNDLLAALAEGDVDNATAIAEKRLGMSSLSLHGAEQLSKFMPQGMAMLGTRMHHAASRFVIVARDAELDPGRESQRNVYKALQEITDNCNACHQTYRIR